MRTKITPSLTKKFILYLLGLFISSGIYAQLTISTAFTPQQLVQNVLVGTGVTVSNITYIGAPFAIGKFSTGPSPTNLGFSSGIIMSTGLVNGSPGIGSAGSLQASTNNSQGSDPQLASLVPTLTIYDASVLKFDFVPISDTIKFRYVFASEEYPEFVNANVNDVFGFFVSGPDPASITPYNNFNIARIPGTNLPVTIDNVNSGSYPQYYINNGSGTTIVYDGFTTILTAWCLVVPCMTYHLKLAIGDAGDGVWDSGVFLEANSFSSPAISLQTTFSSPGVSVSNAVEGCNDAIIKFSLPSIQSSPYPISFAIAGTATNGVDYTTIPNYVMIPAGQSFVNLVISPILDGIPEGTESVKLIVQTSICGNTDSISVNILNNNPLSAVSSNDTMIVCGGSASLHTQANGGITPYTYLWDNGLGTLPNVSVSPTVTTTYNVTVTDLCGTTITDSITVSVSSNTDAGPDVTICSGQNTTLTATGGSNFLWSTGGTTSSIIVSPVTTTTYFVTFTGVCYSYDSVTINVNPLPTITATSTPPSIPMGSSSQVCAQGGNAYTWTSIPPDPTLSGQENIPCATVSPMITTIYRVVGTDTNGCQNTATTTVSVIPIPPIVDFWGDTLEGCVPLKVNFHDSSTLTSQGSEYYWDFGNGTFSYDQNPVAYYDQNGSFTVTLKVTNPGGGIGVLRLSNYITAYQNPIAMFSTNPENTTTILNPVFQFYDHSLGNPNYWYWTFGDGGEDSIQNTTHNYSTGDYYYQFPMMEDTGSFLVTLIVTTEHGCKDTTYKNLLIEPTYSLLIPNAFTPNGDEKNQNFCISNFGILKDGYSIVIFNRWGQKVFYSTDIEECWNGKVNNSNPVSGTYVYRIGFMDAKRVMHEQKGTITIFQ